MIARNLGRSHAELLASLSARELTWQKALYIVEAEERQEAAERHGR